MLSEMFVVAAESVDGVDRLFGLDLQLLFDSAIELLAIFILFVVLSRLLFNPVRELLRKRKEGIQASVDAAQKDQQEAARLKAEYADRLREVDKEAEGILSETRKKALKQEAQIMEEAKAEAARTLERANREIALEKSKVRDEVKQEMIQVAALMAGKFVTASMDDKTQKEFVDETLKEIGDETWQN